jgi:methyltransferase (TIGR00027 family)
LRVGEPSHTARGAAACRAVHQTLEGGAIFHDPFALRILDNETRAGLDGVAADVSLRPLRLFIAARSRFSESSLAACVARGVRQVVVLGAGLDTFSLRNPYAELGVRVFEVDYPATQEWKRELLKQAGLAIPASLTFAPVDFERQSLAEALAAAGFAAARPAFFQWLGVVPYLTREAISLTLDFVAAVSESEVVFDYAEPLENYSDERRAHVMAVAERAAARGEPWLSLFDPAELAGMLSDKRFGAIEDLGMAEIADRFYGDLKQGIAIGPGAHLVRAKQAREDASGSAGSRSGAAGSEPWSKPGWSEAKSGAVSPISRSGLRGTCHRALHADPLAPSGRRKRASRTCA